jgi:hypothetical protein
MCDQQTRDTLEQIVNDKVNNREMFTALDITRAAQGQGIQARHRDLKNDIHGILRNVVGNVYSRTLIQIAGVTEKPMLYYPAGTDPDTYVSPAAQGQTATATATATPSTAHLQTAPTFPKAKVPGASNRDRRGRIWIPSRFLSGIGAATGDEVAVAITQGSLKVAKSADPTLVNYFYTVDRHGNIAISATAFQKAGIDNSTSGYKINGSASQIEVVPA